MDWPDWRGRAVAIIASGPSTTKADVEALKGRLPVLAIKKNIEIAPFADVVYGCDYPWWRSVRGLPDFKGLKLSYDPRDLAEAGVHKIEIELKQDRILTGRTGHIGSGGNSGFQALNLAVQFGAARILLVGFDCQTRSGVHWYGRNGWNMANNPSETQFGRWIAAFKRAADDFGPMGVEVVNASQVSAIRAFPRRSVKDTLEQWGLT